MTTTCTNRDRRPAVARGLCTTCYKAGQRAGTLPPRQEREPSHQIALRMPAETWEALEQEAREDDSTPYAVALRVLATWASRR